MVRDFAGGRSHGIENPDISYRDSLAEEHGEDAGRYSLILANPPFAGSLDYDTTAKDLLKVVKTKKTELLFMGLFLHLMRTGGRAAVVVPDGVLFGSSKAHKDIRGMLVEDHKLDAIIKMPSGVFRPYAGVSCAIVVFTKTGPVAFLCRPTCSFRPLSFRKRPGFSNPVLSAAFADCRSR
ncbi:hypothetical protein A3734_19910 [Sulfitobacter sp. HI0054]|nr:hypothetical protein A3734_19910 [Sulfitobacter sp. HI0054]